MTPGRLRLAGLTLLAVLLWLLPYQLNVYWISVADTALLFALLAIGMGLVMGIAGQVNLAQIAFFGTGAYVTAILTTHSGYGFWVAGLLALLATVLAGLVVGTPALRIQSHYLGIVTLGLAVAFVDLITNAPVTGGDSGIAGIPAPPLPGIDLTSQYLYYYLELVVLALGLAFGLFVVRTPLGRRMRAMRDDALAASASGAEIGVLRMIAFVLASVYGGAAGVLYAGLVHYVAPETFRHSNGPVVLMPDGTRKALIPSVEVNVSSPGWVGRSSASSTVSSKNPAKKTRSLAPEGSGICGVRRADPHTSSRKYASWAGCSRNNRCVPSLASCCPRSLASGKNMTLSPLSRRLRRRPVAGRARSPPACPPAK